jgi:integrase
MPRRINFTRARLAEVRVPVDAAGNPTRDRVYVFDTQTPSLAFMRAAGGTTKFYFVKKINGTLRRYPLADGAIAVDDARKLALAELHEYAKGIDVRTRRLEERRQMSTQQLFIHWRTVEGAKKRSIAQYEGFFEYAAPLHGRKINAVTQHDVAKLHADIGEKVGHVTANRVLAVLSIIFRWSAAHLGTQNPVRGIKRFPEYARERFMQPAELVKFYAAIDNDPDPTWRDYWKMLIFTGARRENVSSMRWADVDVINAAWRIPAHSAKGKRAVTVPLSEDALAVLRERLQLLQSEEWVFPSHSKSGHIAEPKAAWARLLARAGLDDLRIHDIRRTVGSYMAMSGVSDRLIGGALGQTTAQATNVYARLRSEPVRAAMLAGMTALQAARAKAIADAKAEAKRRKAAAASPAADEGKEAAKPPKGRRKAAVRNG